MKVELIWSGRWSLIKLLYFGARYPASFEGILFLMCEFKEEVLLRHLILVLIL